MPASNLACSITIQKKLNASNNPGDASIELLAKTLRSRGPVGQALRTLIRLVKNSDKPYGKEDLATLLALSIAQQRNRERK